MSTDASQDILHGAEPIRAFLGFEKRSQVYHYASNGTLPTFRIGTTICARKSTLLKWIEEQEQGSRTGTDG